MFINFPAITATLRAIARSETLLPNLVIRDIRQLNFEKIRRAGYRGIVIDKDNCITRPYRDELVPELKDAWKECQDVFGRENVLIVSNSAGTRQDPGGLAAENITVNLKSPVLIHDHPKPSRKCISLIKSYFHALPLPSSSSQPVLPSELVIIGDRVLTDIVMSNSPLLTGSLGVLTTQIWQKESLGTMTMRRIEMAWMRNVMEKKRRVVVGEWSKSEAGKEEERVREFIKPSEIPEDEPVKAEPMKLEWWNRF